MVPESATCSGSSTRCYGAGPGNSSGVSKRAFGYLRHYTWTRVVGWLREKHRKTNWKALRRHYSTQGWWPHHAGVELFNPAAVAVTRYATGATSRHRGPSPPA